MSESDQNQSKPSEAVGTPLEATQSDSDRTVIEFTEDEMKESTKVEILPATTAVVPAARPAVPQVLPAAAPGGPLGPVVTQPRNSGLWPKARKVGLAALAIALVFVGAYFVGQSTRKSDAAVDAQITAIQAAQNKATNGALDAQKTTYAKLTRKRSDAAFKKGETVGYTKGFSENSTPSSSAVTDAYQSGKSSGYVNGYSCGRYSTNCGE
jgi:hypothetical protein